MRNSFTKNEPEKGKVKRRPRRPKRSKQTVEDVFAPSLKKEESEGEAKTEEDSLMSSKYWRVADKENEKQISPIRPPEKTNDVARKVQNFQKNTG